MQVYLYTFPNGKHYVGQTIYTYQKRAGKDGCLYTNYIGNAIKNAGWNNIKKRVLQDNVECQEDLNAWEQWYIALYHTTDKNRGYNLDKGGSSAGTHDCAESTKQKIGAANKGKTPWNKGKHGVQKCSPTARLNLSKDSSSKHWYNNGINETFSRNCPDGWQAGRLFHEHPSQHGKAPWNKGLKFKQ